jgi:hypothetical protein
MKFIFLLFSVFFLPFTVNAQQQTSIADTSGIVSFVVTIEPSQGSKDGYYYLNGYVVDIKDDIAKTLYHKKVKITGKAVKVQGLDNGKERDARGNLVIKQGREGEYWFIPDPEIQVIQ